MVDDFGIYVMGTIETTADTRWREDDEGTLMMPRKQSAFLDWLLSEVKNPTSQAQWALENEVHERTVLSWKVDNRFRTEWEKRAAEKNISPDRIQEVVDTIYMAAKGGDFKAAETYLKYVERFLPPPERRTNDKGIQGMSDAELDAALKDLVS